MKYLLLVLFLFSGFVAKTQSIKQWVINPKSICLGGYTSGDIQNWYNSTGKKTANFVHLSYYPRIGIMVSKSFLVGAYFLYGTIRGNAHPNFNYYGVGTYVRYYILPHKNIIDFNEANIKASKINKFYYERLKFMAELSYLRTNYYYSSTQIYHIEQLENNVLGLSLGFNVRIWKGVCLEWAYRGYYFPTSPYRKFSQLHALLGIDIYFNNKTKL